MTKALDRPGNTPTQIELSAAVKEQFALMIQSAPRMSGGGVENILSQIFGADTPDALDKPWDEIDRALPLGVPILVDEFTVWESDFADGLGVYLVIDCTVLHSGEKVQYVTGSVSIVAALAKARSMGWFPLKCVAVEAQVPTKDGYKPQHLEVITDESKAAGKPRGK